MEIRCPNESDWEHFYSLAHAEGWRVPALERQLFRGPWSGCARMVDVDGTFCGLVTAVAHEQSGWICNLIVPPRLRGRGYGAKLFEAARSALVGQGMSSIWLTASEPGRPLYERAGFITVNRIERWVLPARKGCPADAAAMNVSSDVLLNADRSAWGEERHSFLELLARHGQVCACDDAVALLQKGSDLQIIGPWYTRESCIHSNQRLLQKLMAVADPSLDLVIDLLTSSSLPPWFSNAGFACAGQADLMAYGDVSSVDLQMMVSLSSLGSVG